MYKYAKKKSIKASQIARFLRKPLKGQDFLVEKAMPIDNLTNHCFSFIRDGCFKSNIIKKINQHPQALIICSPKFKDRIKCSLIISEKTYFDFSQVLKKFFACPRPKITIGKNCSISPRAIIGGPGFSFQKNEKDINERVYQIGGVTLGNNVEVGHWSSIDRGILTDTHIDDNVKIDNLVHIAHNCTIGAGTVIVAGASFGGGVIVGKNCFIGLNACIRQRIKIGDNVTIGMGAVVVKNVPNNITVIGNPAKPLIKK